MTNSVGYPINQMSLGLMVLIGLPGSGKTTLSKTLVNNYTYFKERKLNFIHICYDELLEFSKDDSITDWKNQRNTIISEIGNLIISIKSESWNQCPQKFAHHLEKLDCSIKNIVLIIDDNMYFKSMRYSLFQIAKKYNIGFCQVFLKCSVELALLKNTQRVAHSVVPSSIIIKMNDKLEPPDINNKWEKYSLEIEAFCDLNQVCDKLFSTLNDSMQCNEYTINSDPKQRELSFIQCKKNVLHQTDLALRKIIGQKIKAKLCSTQNEGRRELVLKLNNRKLEILCDIKAGNICLTSDVLEEINKGDDNKYALYEFLTTYF